MPPFGNAIVLLSLKAATWPGQWHRVVRLVGCQRSKVPKVLRSNRRWTNVKKGHQVLVKRAMFSILMEVYALDSVVVQQYMMRQWLDAAMVRFLILEHKTVVLDESTIQRPPAVAKVAFFERNHEGVAVINTFSTAIHMDAVWRMGHKSFDLVRKTVVLHPKVLVEFLPGIESCCRKEGNWRLPWVWNNSRFGSDCTRKLQLKLRKSRQQLRSSGWKWHGLSDHIEWFALFWKIFRRFFFRSFFTQTWGSSPEMEAEQMIQVIVGPWFFCIHSSIHKLYDVTVYSPKGVAFGLSMVSQNSFTHSILHNGTWTSPLCLVKMSKAMERKVCRKGWAKKRHAFCTWMMKVSMLDLSLSCIPVCCSTS